MDAKKMNNDDNDLVIVFCPPHPEYQEQPKDMSHCELVDCPRCHKKMWLSERKRGVLALAKKMEKEIVYGCYDCVKKLAMSDSSFLKKAQSAVMVDLK